MDSEVVEVLKEIRDEVKGTNARLDQTNARLDQTNARLDQTNARLEAVESRLQFVEKRVTNGFAGLGEKIDKLAQEQLSGFVTVEGVLSRVHAAIVHNVTLLDHERRLAAIEKQRS